MQEVTLLQQLKRHEGLRLKAYKDSEGIWTIGYGRNLQELSISDIQAERWLAEDIEKAKHDVFGSFPVCYSLTDLRQNVLVNMCFNLGISRLRKFKKMWKAIHDANYDEAAIEMLDSKWAKQVGRRATELANEMRKGY